MGMSVSEWRVFSKGSAIKRARRSGFLRDVAVALGNKGDPASAAMTAIQSELSWSVRSGHKRDHGGLVIRPLHAFDWLYHTHHVEHPIVEQDLALLSPALLPRFRDVARLVNPLRQPLP